MKQKYSTQFWHFFRKNILSHLKTPSLHSRNEFHDYMPGNPVHWNRCSAYTIYISMVRVVEFHSLRKNLIDLHNQITTFKGSFDILQDCLSLELSKIGNFQSSESFFEAKFHSIFLGVIFLFEYQSRRTTFNKNICN